MREITLFHKLALSIFAAIVILIIVQLIYATAPTQATSQPADKPQAAEYPVVLEHIPIGPVYTELPAYWPSQSWFSGIMELETGGDPEAFKENPFFILEPFWYEGVPPGEDWDYLTYRHDIWMSQAVIIGYLYKYGVTDDATAAMVFRRGPTGSGWKYWRALEKKLEGYRRIEIENQ